MDPHRYRKDNSKVMRRFADLQSKEVLPGMTLWTFITGVRNDKAIWVTDGYSWTVGR